MKRQMRLLTGDEPVNDVKMALMKERHDRDNTVSDWVAAGKVRILYNDDPVNITLVVGDNSFTCLRTEFPTTLMVAQMGLALASGQGDEGTWGAEQIKNYHAADAMAYSSMYISRRELEDLYGDAWGPSVTETFMESPALNAVTATVKTTVKAKIKKLFKGRP